MQLQHYVYLIYCRDFSVAVRASVLHVLIYSKIRPLRSNPKLDVKINIKTASHTRPERRRGEVDGRACVFFIFYLGVCVPIICIYYNTRVYALRRTAVTSKAAQLPPVNGSHGAVRTYIRARS